MTFPSCKLRAREIELHLAHRLVAQIGHETRDDAVADDERNLPPLAHLLAGLRALHDHDVLGISIAGGMVDDRRAELQALDFGVGVGERLTDERRHGHGRREGKRKS